MFRYLVPVLRRADNLERAAYELAEDCHNDGVCYVEARYAPALTVAPGFTAEAGVRAVLKGLARAKKDFGVDSRVILCLLRGQKPAESRETVRIASRLKAAGVAALDLAGTETLPTRDYLPYFEQAKAAGLELTCHAGETGGREHLESALAAGVSRIGHGTALHQAPDLLEQVRRRGICVEVSLSSNVATGAVADLRAHPFLDFHRGGAAVCLNTDDKGVFGIDLSGEYRLAAAAGASQHELAALALAGARHAFLPPAQRRALAAKIRRGWSPKAPALSEAEA
jgi:adenosine deaminase